MYLERLSSQGIDTSEYYVPGGKYNTSPSGSDVQMPNCTMYAFCRGYEMSEATERFDLARVGGGFGNAKDWYRDSPLPKGEFLMKGSIACFDGKYGHVACVERVIDENHALISESQYDPDKSLRNYKYWQKRIVELEVGKATLSGVGELQGFLYLPIKDNTTSRKNKAQIEILEEYVNVRTSANGSIKVDGCYCPMGIYDVLNQKEVDGWIWYKIDSKSWVREGDWLKYYPEENSLKEENEQLKADMKRIEEIVKRWI